MSYTIFHYYLLVMLVNSIQINAESMLNWIWSKKEELPMMLISEGVPLISISYEMLTEDEKFLKEAAKFVTDIQVSSRLEICQHKVVLRIKTECASMTEEQLAKLSVNLLKCQSEIEERKIFPCTENMSIRECTTHMDADTWNAYHLMSNRARAVCYSMRSHQFRALTELTINKLMQSTHLQIQTLTSLQESQNRLAEQIIAADKIIKSNLEDLTEEKALILTSHTQLANMTEDIQIRLEKASQDFLTQTKERIENHKEILSNLKNIQSQTKVLWEKIENSTNHIIKQNSETILQYEKTLSKIEKINQTIIFIYDLTNNMSNEINKKLEWITEYMGTTGENLEKISYFSLHVIYLFGAMIIAAFLQTPFVTRITILAVVPINLICYLKHGLNANFGFITLSFLLIIITGKYLKAICNLMKPGLWMKLKPMEELSCSYVSARQFNNYVVINAEYPSISDDSSDYSDLCNSEKFIISNDSNTHTTLKQQNLKKCISPLTSFFKRNHKSIQIDQPIQFSSKNITLVTRSLCNAKTRSGNPCRSLSSKGQDYSFRHISGSSNIDN